MPIILAEISAQTIYTYTFLIYILIHFQIRNAKIYPLKQNIISMAAYILSIYSYWFYMQDKLCHPSIYKMNILNACQFPIFVKVSMQLQDIEHPLCLGFLFEKGDYPLDILCFTRKRLSWLYLKLFWVFFLKYTQCPSVCTYACMCDYHVLHTVEFSSWILKYILL